MATEDPPGYNEPLDSTWIDPDPDFRETLRLLNTAGVRTVSSCQGHAPGTQYEEVQEWMEPYITCICHDDTDAKRARNLLSRAGALVGRRSGGRIRASFPREWDWSISVAALAPRQSASGISSASKRTPSDVDK